MMKKEEKNMILFKWFRKKFAKCLLDVNIRREKKAGLGLVCYGLTFWAREQILSSSFVPTIRNYPLNETNAI